jgi:hypothetical protein
MLWANLLFNGGFERPNLTVPSDTYPAGSTDIPGWLVTTFAPAQVSIMRSDFLDGDLTFLPHAGDQSLNLTGDLPGEAAGVEQTIKLEIGHQYDLTFWIGNQDNSIPKYSLDSTAALYINGDFISFYTNDRNNHDALNWKKFSYDFTATTNDTTIQFSNATLTFDAFTGLDGVDLEDVTGQSTPEPATMWLAGLSLLFIAALAKKSHLAP